MRTTPTILALALALTPACGDDGGGGDGDTEIEFRVEVGDATAACGQSYDNLGANGDSAQIKDMRMYVSRVRLIGADGEVPFQLSSSGDFQDGQVALLDFEDGSAGCSDTGDGRTNTSIVGTVPAGEYTGIAFDVGVPFAINHEDVTAAAAPLNVGEMYWAWAIGHRFLRVDLDVNNGANRWNIHTGSTMCGTPDMMTPPTAECTRPNRAEISLDNFTLGTSVVVLDIAPLVADSDITANVDGTAFGCQSFPDDSDECTNLYPNLGMDFSTGACANGCADQSAFRVE